MDPLLDVQDVSGKKADPWNSSPSSLLTQHLATMMPKSSWTENAWMNSPAVLPPPPSAKLSTVHASAAPVNVDPWQSSVESSQRMYFVVECFYDAFAKFFHRIFTGRLLSCPRPMLSKHCSMNNICVK